MQKQNMFSMYDVPYIDRFQWTWHTTLISLMKQNMHILMFHSNHCWFILTIYLQLHIRTPKQMHYPYYIIVPSLASVCCPLLRCCDNDTVKCLYTGPISWLTYIFTRQNTLHKWDFMLISCTLKNLNTT